MNLQIFDETLRDGEQMPGLVFSFNEKLKLAEEISDFGVDYIRLMPSVSAEEADLTRVLTDEGIRVSAVCPMKKEFIEEVAKLGVKRIALFHKFKEILKNPSQAIDLINYSKDFGLKVELACEGASTSNLEELDELVEISKNVSQFIYSDTSGLLTPWKTKEVISRISKKVNVEFHGHNDLGMASANTLMAIKSGATAFSGTFCGIGERAGNAAIEEVVVALKVIEGINLNVNYKVIKNLCEKVGKVAGITLPPQKPIVGSNAFAHESGIHVNALLKGSSIYEPFDPSIVGNSRVIVFGKHSGKSNLKYLLSKYGIPYKEDELGPLLDKLKTESLRKKRNLTEQEVLKLYEN